MGNRLVGNYPLGYGGLEGPGGSGTFAPSVAFTPQ